MIKRTMGLAKSRRGILVIAMAGVLITLVMSLRGCNSRPARESAVSGVMRSAAPILDALERYHVDFGRYPNRLENLNAVGLHVIPDPGWGDNVWFYSSDGSNYGLSVQRVGLFKIEEIFKERDSEWHRQ